MTTIKHHDPFRADIASFRRILDMLRSDPQFLAFHEGRSTTLPRFYRRSGARVLGRYAELLSPADLTSDLSPAPADHQPHRLTLRNPRKLGARSCRPTTA